MFLGKNLVQSSTAKNLLTHQPVAVKSPRQTPQVVAFIAFNQRVASAEKPAAQGLCAENDIKARGAQCAQPWRHQSPGDSSDLMVTNHLDVS